MCSHIYYGVKIKTSTLLWSSDKNNKEKQMKLITNLTHSAKALASAVLMLSLIACGGNDYVGSADRNDLITLGD